MFCLGNLGLKLKKLWVANTGPTAHMCITKGWFENIQHLNHPKTCKVGDGSEVELISCGSVRILANINGE